MDQLELLFQKQKELQARLGYDLSAMPVQERVAYIKEYVLHMEHEAHEMLQELPFFKPWKDYSNGNHDYAEDFVVAWQEWADVVHFFLNVTIALGFTPETLVEAFLDKNAINHQRQEDHFRYKKCVGGTE